MCLSQRIIAYVGIFIFYTITKLNNEHMILGSHNSWSYLKPQKWWMRLLSFTAKCQCKTIEEQYEKYGVRCFDLRLRYINGEAYVVHNDFVYGKFWGEISQTLQWLNDKRDVAIRVIHDVRTKSKYKPLSVKLFKDDCKRLEEEYPNILFWNGKNLYNLEYDYNFEYFPKCIEKYSSVCPPRILDDWLPFLYATIKNKWIYRRYKLDNTYTSILLIDFVNIK